MSEHRVAVDVPEDWIELDVDPETSAQSIERYCDDAFGTAEELQAWRSEVEAGLRLTASQASDAGALAVLFYSELLDEEPWLLSASVVVSLVQTGGDAVSVRELADHLVQDEVEVATVELDLGPAVRTKHIARVLQPGADEAIDLLFVRFHVPLPDDKLIAVAGFSTPTLPLEQEFTELFDAIASTLAVDVADSAP